MLREALSIASGGRRQLSLALLGLLVPEAELLLRHVVIKGVALLAAADAAFVGRDLARGVAAPAVLEHAGVPLDAQRVAADAGLPAVRAQPAALQVRQVGCLRQDLKHGAVHSCGRKQILLREVLEGEGRCRASAVLGATSPKMFSGGGGARGWVGTLGEERALGETGQEVSRMQRIHSFG